MKKVKLLGSLLVVFVVSACSGGSGGSPGDAGGDKTPPAITNPLPSGTLAPGTKSVNLQVATDKDATCKYSASSTDEYAAMTAFKTTGAKSHSSTIDGLTDNTTYDRYVRCSDANGNANTTSTKVSWKIAAAGTGTATLNWAAPTTNKDGGKLTELSGYKIFHCLSASGPCTNYDATPATTTELSYTANGLATGANCFAVKAYNSGGDSEPAPCANGNCCKTIP